MSLRHFNLNRPIHLARRDAYFEKAVELLSVPMQSLDSAARLQQVDRVMSMLRTARKHAFFATLSPSRTDEEKDFLHFLKLISHNVQSAQSMAQHESHLEGEESFLCQFLNATPDQCALPALHYRRRADDIWQGVWHLLRLAHTPYRQLRDANVAALTEEEKKRYRQGYTTFRDDLKNSEHDATETAPGIAMNQAG